MDGRGNSNGLDGVFHWVVSRICRSVSGDRGAADGEGREIMETQSTFTAPLAVHDVVSDYKIRLVKR